jgi:hypothetical protein
MMPSLRRARRALPCFRHSIALLVLSLTPACSGGHHEEGGATPAPIPSECEAYVSAYERCLVNIAPSSAAAHDRAMSTRAAFAAQARDETKAAQLPAQCSAALTQIRRSCP